MYELVLVLVWHASSICEFADPFEGGSSRASTAFWNDLKDLLFRCEGFSDFFLTSRTNLRPDETFEVLGLLLLVIVPEGGCQHQILSASIASSCSKESKVVGSFAGSSIFPFAFLVHSSLSNMEGVVVRRVIPSDNSCLFNAVGYVMDHDKNKATALREVIAATVSSDPVKYSEAFLGKPNEEYCSWILNSEKWGGAIELSILADYYAREIAAYDIQTSRCDLYGQDRNFSERVMLIYDGLHYDALAMSPFEGAPEDFDETIFTIRGNRTVGPVEGLALSFVKEQQRQRKYTDTANFTLRCGICQRGVKGEKEAVEHAQATGHVNFQEYR